MCLTKIRLIVIMSLSALAVIFGVLGAAPVLAIGPMGSGIEIMVFDDDHVAKPSGNSANGTHGGTLTCYHESRSCEGKVAVVLVHPEHAQGQTEIEYSFRSMDAYSADRPKRMVATGDGKIDNGGSIEAFTFALVIEDPGNGRLSLSYQATNPQASLELEVPDTWVSSQ